MKPKELPDDWIVQTSRNLPNRVYYFNTKTNKSYWKFPTEELQNAGTSMPAAKGRKRKTEASSSEVRPHTPDSEVKKKNKSEGRRILKAKRTIDLSQNEESSEPKDTPQMILLRERMLERRSKGGVSRSLNKKSLEPPQKEAEDPKNVPEEKPATIGDSSQEAQSLTPQMRVLLEKIKNKKPKAGIAKNLARKSMAPETKTVPLERRRRRSMDVAGSSASEVDFPTLRSSRTGTAVRKKVETTSPRIGNRREIEEEVAECLGTPSPDKPKAPRLGRSARKNLAEERLAKLQRSLTEEKDKVDGNSLPRESLERVEIRPIESKATESPPSIYNNAEVRVKLLRERLQNKMLYDKGASPSSVHKGSKNQDIHAETLNITPEDDFYEEMDWAPIEDEKIMREVQAVRSHIFAIGDSSVSQEIPPNSLDLPDGPIQGQRKPSLYIVIDTNVFLSNLRAVEEARDAFFKNYGRPLIVVPWTVIRELDFIKDDKSMSRPESLRAKARQAVRLLNQHFTSRHPRVLGQTPNDVFSNREKFEHECPDDEILQTCLQIRRSHNNVVLLSYDKNLCNKAMIHDIVTLGRNDPLEKVDYLHASEARNDSFLSLSLRGEEQDIDTLPIYAKELRQAEELMEAAKETLTSFMSVIVAGEMQNLYGNNWEKHTIIKPPWSLRDVLRCAIKHWIGAVSESFSRRAEHLLKGLLETMTNIPDSGRKFNDVKQILETIHDLLQCVKIEKYPNIIAESTVAISDLRIKCIEMNKKLYEEQVQDNWGLVDETREKEEEHRAAKAFQQFEEVYAFARDMCGLACNAIGMPCSFPFKKLNPEPTPEQVKEIQPDIAANLNRLLQVLGTALEDINNLRMDNRAVEALYHALSTFMPDYKGQVSREFGPTDVYWCLKKKEKVLRLGLAQLQELSSHFCRMASFRCT